MGARPELTPARVIWLVSQSLWRSLRRYIAPQLTRHLGQVTRALRRRARRRRPCWRHRSAPGSRLQVVKPRQLQVLRECCRRGYARRQQFRPPKRRAARACKGQLERRAALLWHGSIHTRGRKTCAAALASNWRRPGGAPPSPGGCAGKPQSRKRRVCVLCALCALCALWSSSSPSVVWHFLAPGAVETFLAQSVSRGPWGARSQQAKGAPDLSVRQASRKGAGGGE